MLQTPIARSTHPRTNVTKLMRNRIHLDMAMPLAIVKVAFEMGHRLKKELKFVQFYNQGCIQNLITPVNENIF